MKTAIEGKNRAGDIVIATVTTERGYLSITGEVYGRTSIRGETKIVRNGKTYWCHSCGQVRNDMCEAFANDRAFMRLMPFHLANVESGEPMHYVANAIYWF